MENPVIDAFKKVNMLTAQDSNDHEAMFEISYRYLSKVKNFSDIRSFHNCIISLINCDRYYRALQLLGEVSEEIHAEFLVEKAYVYYKTGHFERLAALYEATITYEKSKQSSVSARALKHMMAQSHYQNGHITEALLLYRELIQTNTVDNELDIACNERAIITQLMAKEKHSQHAQTPVSSVSAAEKTYDFVFNSALIELLGNNVSGALRLLEEASAMCLEQNMDSDPADLALEIAPIKLTIAYIHQISGQKKQALSLLEDMDLASVTDLMTRLVFRNNYVSLTGLPINANFAARELNYKNNLHHLRHKLTKPQFQILAKNNLLVAYRTGTLPRTSSFFRSKFYNQYSADFRGDVTPLLYKVLLKIDVSVREMENGGETGTICRKLYKFCLHKLHDSPTVDDETVAAALLLVHLNSRSAKYEQAILVVEKLVALELKQDPAHLHASLFGTLINMYEALNSSKKIDTLCVSITEKLVGVSPESLAMDKDLYAFARAFAFRLSAGHTLNIGVSSISSVLQLLKKANPTDALVSSVLDGDHSGLIAAEQLASSDDVETLLAVDIDDIIVSAQASAPVPLTKKTAAHYKVTKKLQKPKFSKNKILKTGPGFDPEKDLNKERWIPLKLRSYYKPSKKDLKKKSGGHQGAVELTPTLVVQQHHPAATSSAPSKNKGKNKKKKKGKK